jgi:hypothetical protein
VASLAGMCCDEGHVVSAVSTGAHERLINDEVTLPASSAEKLVLGWLVATVGRLWSSPLCSRRADTWLLVSTYSWPCHRHPLADSRTTALPYHHQQGRFWRAHSSCHLDHCGWHSHRSPVEVRANSKEEKTKQSRQDRPNVWSPRRQGNRYSSDRGQPCLSELTNNAWRERGYAPSSKVVTLAAHRAVHPRSAASRAVRNDSRLSGPPGI